MASGPAADRAARVDRYESPDGVRVFDGGTLGLSLLPYLEDARRVILVDAVHADAPRRHVRAARRRRRRPGRRDAAVAAPGRRRRSARRRPLARSLAAAAGPARSRARIDRARRRPVGPRSARPAGPDRTRHRMRRAPSASRLTRRGGRRPTRFDVARLLIESGAMITTGRRIEVARHRPGCRLPAVGLRARARAGRDRPGAATTRAGVTIDAFGDRQRRSMDFARRLIDVAAAGGGDPSMCARSAHPAGAARHVHDREQRRGPRSCASPSRRTSRPVPNACAESSIRPTAAIATRSPTAPTADRASRSRSDVPYDRAATTMVALHDVRRLPARYRRSGGSPVPCATECVPRVRPAA